MMHAPYTRDAFRGTARRGAARPALSDIVRLRFNQSIIAVRGGESRAGGDYENFRAILHAAVGKEQNVHVRTSAKL